MTLKTSKKMRAIHPGSIVICRACIPSYRNPFDTRNYYVVDDDADVQRFLVLSTLDDENKWWSARLGFYTVQTHLGSLVLSKDSIDYVSVVGMYKTEWVVYKDNL